MWHACPHQFSALIARLVPSTATVELIAPATASTYVGFLPDSLSMDNTKHFWRYNHRGRSLVTGWTPRKPRRKPERIQRRERAVLQLLITAGQPVHIDRIAEELRLSQAATRSFLLAHGRHVWTGEGPWWRTTLREMPRGME